MGSSPVAVNHALVVTGCEEMPKWLFIVHLIIWKTLYAHKIVICNWLMLYVSLLLLYVSLLVLYVSLLVLYVSLLVVYVSLLVHSKIKNHSQQKNAFEVKISVSLICDTKFMSASYMIQNLCLLHIWYKVSINGTPREP